MNYLVVDCVTLLEDTAQLYWKFIGSNSGVDTKNAKVIVHIPDGADKEKLKIWGHGPLSGKVSLVNSNTAVWEVMKLPKDRFLEARFLFPRELIPEGKVIDEGINMQYVLNQERDWAKNAEKERREIRAKYIAVFGFMALVFLLSLLFYLDRKSVV